VPRALTRWLNQVIDLAAMLLNHLVQLIVPAAREQKRLDLQDGPGTGVTEFCASTRSRLAISGSVETWAL